MKLHEFEQKMKQILHKVSEVSEMNLDWQVVSTDPDCVSDFGADAEGNLSINGVSMLLSIENLTGIRYRWHDDVEGTNCFIRFDFGKDVYLDCCFDYNSFGDYFHAKYCDTYGGCMTQDEAIEFIKKCMEA